MLKFSQSKIAQSQMLLPTMAVYAVVVWLLCGLFAQGWWLQLACFGVTTFLVIELNNVHALIRIYSRMVSSSFLALSCCACFLFPSLEGNLMQMFMAASELVLLLNYQDRCSPGITFYAFVLFGLASLCDVHVVFLLPLLWLFMAINLLSLSWRTWGASVIGVLMPYWFWGCWHVLQKDLTPLLNHFLPLGEY